MRKRLLEIQDLKTYFRGVGNGEVKAVDGVSLTINQGETICLVGESGCGKSVTALSVIGLIPKPPGRIAGGRILFGGADLLRSGELAMSDVRGNKISMIFQEPMTSLNPVLTIGRQVSEVLIRHAGASKKDALKKSEEMLRSVGIPRAQEILREYPHQLSGGMRQRVMIAMALICNPMLLIADEPTTALDVTIQAQVLALLQEMKQKLGTAILLITHDMGVVATMADRVAVMYAGQVVEEADADALLLKPRHPYTKALMEAIPFIDKPVHRLYSIQGTVPDAGAYPAGCRYRQRCDVCVEACAALTDSPPLVEVEPGYLVRCIKEVEP